VKLYNSYILIVAVLFLVSTVILVALEQNSLDIYYTVYTIEALVITELYVYFNAKARRGLNLVTYILSGGFLGVVALKAINILLT